MQTVQNTLSSITLGEPARFLNLSAFPMLASTDYHRDYLTLRAAVQAGTAHVGEASQGGSVPELAVENTGKEPVLVFEGEELIGAKQNRTANVTVLVPAGTRVCLPVTCVEQGRWSYQSPEFSPSQQMHFSRGRAAKVASVSESMRRYESRHADQGEVWEDIRTKSSRMRVASPTSAMSDVFEAHRTRIEDYVGAFDSVTDQIGAVFAINDRVEGLEIFDCRETLTEMLPKLVRSYAIDAIESVPEHHRNATAESAREFVERVRRAEVATYPAVGSGTEVRISSTEVIAAGLVAEGRVVHLAAFAAAAEQTRGGTDPRGLARMRTRRSRMGR